MSSYGYTDWSSLVGLRVCEPEILKDPADLDRTGTLRLELDYKTKLYIRGEGDCCSHTWIEEVRNIEALYGATIRSIREIERADRTETRAEFDVVAFYELEIVTDLGTAVIDYRNESNGYYGGWLVVAREGE